MSTFSSWIMGDIPTPYQASESFLRLKFYNIIIPLVQLRLAECLQDVMI